MSKFGGLPYQQAIVPTTKDDNMQDEEGSCSNKVLEHFFVEKIDPVFPRFALKNYPQAEWPGGIENKDQVPDSSDARTACKVPLWLAWS